MKSPKLEKLLQNKNVLYVISFIAIMNLLGYIMMKNINAAIFFSVVGFLSSYFTKNMIVILLIAMISTNLYVLGNSNVVEAMSNRREENIVAKKKAAKEEAVTINFAFATVVSIENIKKGDILKENNIWVKRPGTGEIKAEFYNDVLDKISLRDIKKGEHLNWKDFE